MHVLDVKLRHRELTQEVYDIGDEVATYIENLAQAVGDFDAELVDDCLAEFECIVTEARHDCRGVVNELVGLRQALVSGVKAGTIGASPHGREPEVERPCLVDAATLEEDVPLASGPVVVGDLARVLSTRTEMVAAHLRCIADWVVDQTAVAADDLGKVVLPVVFARASTLVCAAAYGWLTTVAVGNPAYCKAMRGSNPPEFLAERARIAAVVARVKAKMDSSARGGYAS